VKCFSLLILLFVSVCNAQISQNTWLFAHLNPRPNQPPSGFGSIYAACWGYTSLQGREYAILACVTGTSFIDITDSLNVRECGFVPGPNQPWREMKTYSHYAYVVTDGSGVGMQIIDLQFLPDSVHLVRAWSVSGFTRGHTITQDGRFMYINAGDAAPGQGIRVVDLADPENPVMRGAYTQRLIHDSFIRNDTIFGAAYYDNKFVIIDARDKDNLTVITEFPNLPTYGFPHNCWTTNDRKYLVTTDEGWSPPGSAKIWNIENLNNIIYETSYRPPGDDNTIVHNVLIKDTLLIISHYEAGLRFLSIRNPISPVEIGYYDTYPDADSTAFRGNWGCYPFFASGKFVSSDMQTGLWVIKLNGYGENPVVIKSFELFQNYPNPFNNKSKIKYQISETRFVNLSIFDVRGRLTAVLVNQRLNAGAYEAEFSGEKLASGVYFYRLQAGEFLASRRMILVK
jgi:choice-of-anchor B domain-containing protein